MWDYILKLITLCENKGEWEKSDTFLLVLAPLYSTRDPNLSLDYRDLHDT